MSLSEKFLDSKIYIGEYFATGEGFSFFVYYNTMQNYSFLKNSIYKDFVEEMTIKELLSLIQKDKMIMLKNHVPVMFEILTEKIKEPANISLNFEFHSNYS